MSGMSQSHVETPVITTPSPEIASDTTSLDIAINIDTDKNCSNATLKDVLEPATLNKQSVKINCNLNIPASSTISKKLILEGEAASNIIINCSGSTLVESQWTKGKDLIEIKSLLVSSTSTVSWSVPQNIIIKNCVLNGSMRIYGLGTNGEAIEVKKSSRNINHTLNAQNNAPHFISIEDSTLNGQARVPLYLSPGVNKVVIKNNKFLGQSDSVAIYLDAESKDNIIYRNTFNISTKSREIIALDGSANNVINGNIIRNFKNGGIYIYRNCGEGGTIRHQEPKFNVISYNYFDYRNVSSIAPAVILASRNGNRNYCDNDIGYNFGSSINNNDLAQFNKVQYNSFYLQSPLTSIINNDINNIIESNIMVSDLK